ncbi:MAG: response regulator, partial [Bacteroidota bacterium]
MTTEPDAALPEPSAGTVLVVDDMPANVGVLFDHLSQSGYTVLVAESGASALLQARHGQPDLILLDVQMPGLDGFEVCRRLKHHPETRHIPVLFMTALADAEDKVRGFSMGAQDYITKPFQHEEVVARVETHLTLRRLQDELKAANADLEARVEQRTAELQAALKEVEAMRDRLQDENRYLRDEVAQVHAADGIVGQSPALAKVLGQVERVAATDATVLILGETGTGKELFARAVHAASPRRDRPL